MVVDLVNVVKYKKAMLMLRCLNSCLDTNKNHYACFVIEPLDIGQGLTIANALRRTLITSLSCFAITGIKTGAIDHPFSVVKNLREDFLEMILNLKEVRLKSSFLLNKKDLKLSGFLDIFGPTIVTAGMFQLPLNKIKILNPEQYICTITNKSRIIFELNIEKGKGYTLESINKNTDYSAKPFNLLLDTSFISIKKVNYKIRLIHDIKGNIKESILLEILTNGSITPYRSIQEATKIIIKLFSQILFCHDFILV